MKKLNELYDCNYETEIKGIKMNSKEIEEGDLFICTMGATVDRHDYIEDAIKRGASAIVVSKDVNFDIPTIKVENTNKELPILCSKFYDHPDKRIKMLGVTGTDGKTSVATIVQTLIGSDLCGYIGTNGRSCSKFNKPTNNTTPDSDKLFMYFNDFLEAGCKYSMMEASSEAFFYNRLTTLEWDCTGYTNITSEHLNHHKTLENYIDCKLNLFRQTKKDGFCIINKDDEHFSKVKEASNGKVLTYGMGEGNDLQIVNFDVTPHKTFITFKYQNKEYKIVSPLLGDFNVYNLACAMLMTLAIGFDMEYIINNIKNINISGRLDMLDLGQDFYVMVDYAHTPNGITKLLNFVHTLDINRSIVVIGQAGERDPYKRKTVGKVVCDNASHAIFTYEDPRSEDPVDIINMMIEDIKDTHNNYEIVIDRSEAIKKAIFMSKKKDIVLILGKGNETYEKLKDKVIYFNDIEEAEKYLKERLEKVEV